MRHRYMLPRNPGSAGASPAHCDALAVILSSIKVRDDEGGITSRRGACAPRKVGVDTF